MCMSHLQEKGLFVQNVSIEILTENSLFSPWKSTPKPFPATSLLKRSLLICEIKSGAGNAVVICHKLMEEVDADIDLSLHVAFIEFMADREWCVTETMSLWSVIPHFL